MLDLCDVDVLDHEHPDEGQCHDGRSGNQHPLLRVPVGPLDADPLGAVDGVAQLHVEVVVDIGEVRQGGLGQEPLQGGFEGVCPDGAGDGVADGAADVADDVQHGQHGGDVLVVRGREDRELLHDDENAAADRDEDLAHDDVPDVLVRLAEVDHQALREDVQRHRDEQQPPEVAGLADQEPDAQEQHARDDVERAPHVACLGQRQVAHDLQEGREVAVPAVVGDLVRQVQETRSDDGPVGEKLDVQERRPSEEALVQHKQGENHEPDDDHRDDVARAPAVRRTVGEGEGEEEYRQS